MSGPYQHVRFWMTRAATQYGPFTLQQLSEFAQEGRLEPSDLLWTDGWTQWFPAASIPDLFPEAPPLQQLAAVNQGNAEYVHQSQEIGQRPIIVAVGYNGRLEMWARKIRIVRAGFVAWTLHRQHGDKNILLSRVSSVQLRRPSAIARGYIQFTFTGGFEAKGGDVEAHYDENTVVFTAGQEAAFLQIHRAIENRMMELDSR